MGTEVRETVAGGQTSQASSTIVSMGRASHCFACFAAGSEVADAAGCREAASWIAMF